MKTLVLLLATALLAVTGIKTLSAANTASATFKPTWSGDDHDNPVYTSPTNGLAPLTTREPFTNSLPAPAVTNWPVTNLPPITNWANTNPPALTNPPPLNPPGGKWTSNCRLHWGIFGS
jgi:hypothetical protein